MKDSGEDTYILRMRIYREISQRLLGIIDSTYIEKVLRLFNNHDSNKSACLCHIACVFHVDQVTSNISRGGGELWY